MTQNNKKPSPELLNYLIEIKTCVERLKELYKIVDRKSQLEGYSTDEVYELANNIDIATTTKQHTQKITNNNIDNKTKDANNFPLYFQHFQ
jgi:hypothetical protein